MTAHGETTLATVDVYAGPACLFEARTLDQSRALWPVADGLLPAPREGEQDPPTEGDRMT